MSAGELHRADVVVELEALGVTEAEFDEMLEEQDAELVTLRGELRSLWGEIDDDFEDRAVRRVGERLLDRETLSALADLLGLGLQTGRVLLGSEEAKG